MNKKRKNPKISSTAYRVLLILYLLNKGTYTLEGLTECLSDDKVVARAFSKDVIIKYLATLRSFGVEITKTTVSVNTYYQLKKSPFHINFTEDELETLAIIQNYVNYLHQPYLISCFNSAVTKISRFIPDDHFELFCQYKKETASRVKDNYKQFENIIKLLEQYCLDEQTILITYSPLEGLVQKITFEPEKITYKNQQVYICGNNPKIEQNQCLQLDYIKDIKQLPFKSRNLKYNYNIIFRLTGKLAKSYRLYEREQIIETIHYPSSILVSTHVGNIDTLLHRLIKYGPHCEVISPGTARDKMHKLISDMLDRYDDEIA